MNLGDRMKAYEVQTQVLLSQKQDQCYVVRLDGKAFHSFTKQYNCSKPFDSILCDAMVWTAVKLCETVQNCVIGYTQSDEISLAWTLPTSETQHWFGGKVSKIVSVSASYATAFFNQCWGASHTMWWPPAIFDSRVFEVPIADVSNYFIWRVLDAKRNGISALAQANFPHKSLQNKSNSQMLKMLSDKGVKWEDLSSGQKFGFLVKKVQLPPSTLRIQQPMGGEEVVVIQRLEWQQTLASDDLTQLRAVVDKEVSSQTNCENL